MFNSCLLLLISHYKNANSVLTAHAVNPSVALRFKFHLLEETEYPYMHSRPRTALRAAPFEEIKTITINTAWAESLNNDIT